MAFLQFRTSKFQMVPDNRGFGPKLLPIQINRSQVKSHPAGSVRPAGVGRGGGQGREGSIPLDAGLPISLMVLLDRQTDSWV